MRWRSRSPQKGALLRRDSRRKGRQDDDAASCQTILERAVAVVDDPDVRAHVGVHVDHTAVGVREQQRGGRREGASRERQVRLPGRVDDYRLHEPTAAVRHDEDRQQSRLQGLRRRHTDGLRSQVRHSAWPPLPGQAH